VLKKLNNLFVPARLTRGRMAFALIVAVAVDGLQVALGPLGWVGMVQVLDVLAMVLTTLSIGFHVLLLPTFALEFIPLVDMIPTWTGCVVAVIALRKRSAATMASEVTVSAPVPPKIQPARLEAPNTGLPAPENIQPPNPS
jgi:hypothetical protein